MTTSDKLLTWLKNQGIDTVFVYSGGTCVRLQAEFQRHGFQIYSCGPELEAGYTAMGYFYRHGRPAIVLTISGPGALNATAALFAAARLGMPFLLLEGLPKRSVLGKLSVQDTSALGISSVNATRGLTGCSFEVYTSEVALQALVRATRNMFLKKKPAHLALPGDLLDVPATEGCFGERRIESEQRLVAASRERVSWRLIEEAAQLLVLAKRPLLFVGGDCAFRDKAVEELFTACPVPFVSTVDGKGVLDEYSPFCCGVALPGNELGRRAIADADLLLAIGTELGEFELYGWNAALSGHQRVIHIHPRVDVLAANFDETYPLLGEVTHTVRALTAELAQMPRSAPHNWAEPLHSKYARVYVDCALPGEADRLLPSQVAQVLSALLPSDALFTADIGVSIFALGHHSRLAPPRRSFCPLPTAAVGQTIAHVLGMCLEPGSTTVCLCGDLAFHDAAASVVDAMNWFNKGVPLGKLIWVVLADGHSGLVRAGVACQSQLNGVVDTENGPVQLHPREIRTGAALSVFEVRTAVELEAAFSQALTVPEPSLVIVRTGTGTPPIGARNAALASDQFSDGKTVVSEGDEQ